MRFRVFRSHTVFVLMVICRCSHPKINSLMQSQARIRFAFLTLFSIFTTLCHAQITSIPANTQLLTTSIRTGDTDVFG